jgi:hypothetical protein
LPLTPLSDALREPLKAALKQANLLWRMCFPFRV